MRGERDVSSERTRDDGPAAAPPKTAEGVETLLRRRPGAARGVHLEAPLHGARLVDFPRRWCFSSPARSRADPRGRSRPEEARARAPAARRERPDVTPRPLALARAFGSRSDGPALAPAAFKSAPRSKVRRTRRSVPFSRPEARIPRPGRFAARDEKRAGRRATGAGGTNPGFTVQRTTIVRKLATPASSADWTNRLIVFVRLNSLVDRPGRYSLGFAPPTHHQSVRTR